MSPWHLFFHWPDGGVWSNLLASLIWVPISWAGVHTLLVWHRNKVHAHIEQVREEIKNLQGQVKVDTSQIEHVEQQQERQEEQ